MRTLSKLLVVGFLVAPLASLRAQITLQLSDFQKIFYVGDTLNVTSPPDTTVNVGQVGGPNVYDFSSLNLASVGIIPVVLGSSLPKAASRFPNDTIVVMPDAEQAFTFTSQGMFDVGKVNIENDSTLDYVHRSPYATIFRFPVAFGSSYSETITTYDTMFVNGIETSAGSGPEDWVGGVDGYGTLKLPRGLSYQCLRVYKLETNCPTCTDDLEIDFLTLGGPFILITSDHTQPDTGMIHISSFQVLQARLLTGVAAGEETPTTFSLSQNYPNPFNPSTKIDFEVPMRGFVTLEVFDVLGRKVATLAGEELAAGSYERTFDASALSSGVYFDRFREGNLEATSKLIIVK